MKKSSFFALLAVVLLLLFSIKAGRIISHGQKHTGTFHSLSVNNAAINEKHTRNDHDIGQLDRAIRRRLDADAAAAAPVRYDYDLPESENLFYSRRLAGIYARMNPEDAARIIETLDSCQIIRLLKMMRSEDAAAVLSRIKLEKAREITEQMLEDTGNNRCQTLN